MVDVVGTDEFAAWFDALDDSDTDAVARVVDMLEMQGPTLPFPYSSAIKNSQVPLRELRVQSHGRPLRVFYAFDPVRQAVLLIGGDKTGDDRFYERMVPLAERLWFNTSRSSDDEEVGRNQEQQDEPRAHCARPERGEGRAARADAAPAP